MEKEDELSAPTATPRSKQSFRLQVWEHLESNNLVNFPRPVNGRIPNFKGSEEAAAALSALEVFRTAKNIVVNPDKPQEPARLAVLSQGKNLYVPIPRLAAGLMKKLPLAEDATQEEMRKLVSRRGIDDAGEEVAVEDEVKIDLVVMGSVAVSREGYRIGKGMGYADLEFAILWEMKAVSEDTVVVTIIHDDQVFDELPKEVFGLHDVPVDIIVTPTQVIHVDKPLAKPQGIFWDLVSQRRLGLMPVLKTLYELQKQAGKVPTLKAADSDVESSSERVRRNRYGRRSRIIRRKPIDKNVDNQENVPSVSSPKRRPRRQIRKQKSPIDFSLLVRNIEKTVRVRDLKAALAERGIKPNIITWRGMKGYCCLHFSKTNPNTISDVEDNSHGVDNVLGMLENLTIKSDTALSIEIMKPISRIETTDVTAV